jgi:hypothetical protein
LPAARIVLRHAGKGPLLLSQKVNVQTTLPDCWQQQCASIDEWTTQQPHHGTPEVPVLVPGPAQHSKNNDCCCAGYSQLLTHACGCYNAMHAADQSMLIDLHLHEYCST